jgi:hypothetical protein
LYFELVNRQTINVVFGIILRCFKSLPSKNTGKNRQILIENRRNRTLCDKRA